MGQPYGLVTSPRDEEENHPRKVGESRQGSAVAAGHEQVGSSSQTCATSKESQSSQGFGIFKWKHQRCFTYPKYITECKFKCKIIQKISNIQNYFI